VISCTLMYQLFLTVLLPPLFLSTAAVIFVGTSTKGTDVHGIKKDNKFANTLEDNIIQRGAPNLLLSDRGQAITSKKIEDILQTFCIDSWQSEPHQHHQTPLNNATRP
jgi:hypothetical protein